MNLDLLKKNSIVEKEEAFMPLVFVDMAVPTAAAYTLARQAGYSFKKATITPENTSRGITLALNAIPVLSSQRNLTILRHSINDIEF